MKNGVKLMRKSPKSEKITSQINILFEERAVKRP